MSETARIAGQLRRAFDGEAWHGDSLSKILKGVTAARASARPVTNAHSIWELVLHITAWDGAVRRRLSGKTAKLSSEQNFPRVTDTSEGAWQQALERLRSGHEELIQAVAAFPDSRLGERVPGKQAAHQTFYYMLHGVVQHELYHAGQIAILKKARRARC